MKKIIVTSIIAGTLCLSGLSLTMPSKAYASVHADSESATLIFGHGTAGVDKFYNYCPSIMQTSDGTRYVYYCTNKVAGNITDYIGYRVGTLNGNSYTYSEESLVLSPTANQWDSRHTCDPSVIKGVFSYNSHTYSYLMAYLGCLTSDSSNNEVGLAVSDAPGGPWVKVGTTAFKPFTPTANYNGWEWGYGQPSIISIDKAGQVLFTYTAGQVAGTRIFAEKWNLSNLNNPQQIGGSGQLYTNGLRKYDGTVDSVLNNADFAYDEATGRIYGIGDNHPSAELYPTVSKEAQIIYMEPHKSDLSIGGNLFKYGTWKILKNLSVTETGLNRNHNCGLVRDEYGHLNNPSEIEAIITDGRENPSNNEITALSTYRLYSYKATVNNTESDYMFDVGGNITYNYTDALDLATFRLMPQSQDFSSGNAILVRIKNNTGTDTPIRISFNCTSDYRYRALSNADESKKYYLLSVDGSLNEYPYRTWDGDVWLKPNFDGYLIMKKDDQVTDTTYSNHGTFTWSSIFAIYFALETHYDSYADYDIGDVYTCSINQGVVKFVKPLLQFGLVSEANTTSTIVLDYQGDGRININRKNLNFIPVIELIDGLINVNACSATSSEYNNLLSKYNTISSNGILLYYFNSTYIYDYQNGDTAHTGGLTNKVLARDKLDYIASVVSSESLTLPYASVDNGIVLIVLVATISFISLSLMLISTKKKGKNIK